MLKKALEKFFFHFFLLIKLSSNMIRHMEDNFIFRTCQVRNIRLMITNKPVSKKKPAYFSYLVIY